MPDERSLKRLLGDLVEQILLLLRQELHLARVEIRQKAGQARNAIYTILLGWAFGFAALLVAVQAVVAALATQMSEWAAALLVAVVLGVIAIVFIRAGSSGLRSENLKPERTLQSFRRSKAKLMETLS